MERLITVCERLQQWFTQHDLPMAQALLPELSPDVLTQKLQGFPGHLTHEVYALYQWHNGQSLNATGDFLPHYIFLPFDKAIQTYQTWIQYAAERDAQGHKPAAYYWDPQWFPLFQDNDGRTYYVVQCHTAPHSTSPVYYVSRDADYRVYMAYDSLTHMLEAIMTCYETAAYWVEWESNEACPGEDRRRVAQITLAQNPQRTAWWLAQVPGAQTVETLVAYFEQGDRTAFDALLTLLDPRTVEPLLHVLRENSTMRASAAEILGELGDVRAVTPLVESLGDTRGWVRQSIAEALGKLGDTRAVEPLIAVLHTALSEGDSRVGQATIRALGKLKDTRAVAPLLHILQAMYDPEVRATACLALGELRSLEAVPVLIQVIKDLKSGLQLAAATALGQIKDPRAVDGLIRALEATHPRIRWEAARALGEIGDSRALAPLARLRHDADEIVRDVAEDALAKLQDTHLAKEQKS